MDFLKFLLCILFGFLLSGVWFGLNIVIGILIQKTKISWLTYFNTLLASVIPVFLIYLTLGIYPVKVSGFRHIKVYDNNIDYSYYNRCHYQKKDINT